MRIVIDMQGAQTESRFRGIGRYTMSFALEVARNRGDTEVFLALSGLFPDTIEPIREAFYGILPQENIRVWHAPGPVRALDEGNEKRRNIAELIREAFLASLEPDLIHITSLFEGFVDDAVTSIGRYDKKTPVSVIVYDLIPFQNPEQYLRPNPTYEKYYLEKIEYLKSARLFLAISEFSRDECISTLKIDPERIVNISTAIDPGFCPITVEPERAKTLYSKLGIRAPFILYTGGADERKNLPRLIEAFALMPEEERKKYQLVFAGKMPEGDIARFVHHAAKVGLKKRDMVFTGYVGDDELILLYNLCALYVFPSWHEGFGLPALEAMACGAPVIGSNTSSIPEVIGNECALFNPFDISTMTAKMQDVLCDKHFSDRLKLHNKDQIKKFSWGKTAKSTLGAWRSQFSPHNRNFKRSVSIADTSNLLEKIIPSLITDSFELKKLASCIVQNQNNGYLRQLLLDVSELCQRDSATGVQRVVRSYLKNMLDFPPGGYRVEPVYGIIDGGYKYARRFTAQFHGKNTNEFVDTKVSWKKGDVFFALDMQHHVQINNRKFYEQLMEDGVSVIFLVYDLLPIQLASMFNNDQMQSLHSDLMSVVANSNGAICISKATADSLKAWIAAYPGKKNKNIDISWVHIGADIENSKPSLGIPSDSDIVFHALKKRLTFLCVSTIEPRKCQSQILLAMEDLWKCGYDVNMVFVGRCGWKSEELIDKIQGHEENGKRLFWLNGISDEYLEKIYANSTCLIAASINEGFGLSVIEAAQHGVPIIARDIEVFREIAGENAFYFSGNENSDLSNSIKLWLNKKEQVCIPDSAKICWSTWAESTDNVLKEIIRLNQPKKQLMVDVSELVVTDARTGIQRVVRNILCEWILNQDECFRVEPVYATCNGPYRYARNFMSEYLGRESLNKDDDIVDFYPGDVFFCLDLQPAVQITHRLFFNILRQNGVLVYFMIYDLLPVRIPQCFPPGSFDGFSLWLEVVAENNGVVCISKAVADDFKSWLTENKIGERMTRKVFWAHIGADLVNAKPSVGVPEDAREIGEKLENSMNFIMVGTLEPRKGHEFVLEAFDQLWKEGSEIKLIIIGKKGWLVDTLIEKISRHPLLNQKLFWFQNISDEYLETLYKISTCLIAASYGEGFGLPLIEAAQHGLPVIARDIPVFREVAKDAAFYFKNSESSKTLERAIIEWLKLFSEGNHPKPDQMEWITWKVCAQNILQLLKEDCASR